jgi:hypothetical protein
VNTEAVHADPAAALAIQLVDAITENRLDEAEILLDELNALQPDTTEYLVFPVLIAIQRGFIKEALQYLNTLGENTAPELRALCLNILGDPSWNYHARDCLESDDPSVRKAMRELLQMAPEPELLAA